MNDELRSDVLRRKYGGQSGRDIARDLHLSRKTVAKVLGEHRQQRANGTTGLPKPRQGRGSVVDAYESTLRDFLSRYPDMTVVRLLEECRCPRLYGWLHRASPADQTVAQAGPSAAGGTL